MNMGEPVNIRAYYHRACAMTSDLFQDEVMNVSLLKDIKPRSLEYAVRYALLVAADETRSLEGVARYAVDRSRTL